MELKHRTPEAKKAYYEGYIVAMRLVVKFVTKLLDDVMSQLELAEQMRDIQND